MKTMLMVAEPKRWISVTAPLPAWAGLQGCLLDQGTHDRAPVPSRAPVNRTPGDGGFVIKVAAV